ncbi:MAG: tripartite tricarboxylate transporter TctB family protein [Acetobacteraceae bacterium]
MRQLARIRAGLPYLIVIAIGVFLYHKADNFTFEAVPGRIGPDAWPKIILVLMLVTAFCGFVSSALRAGKPPGEKSSDVAEIEALLRPPEIYPHFVWLSVGATFAYLLLLPLIGFFLGTIIYTLALLFLGHYRRFLRGLALSVIVAAAFMFMFMRAVYVALPTGIPPFDHVSFAVMAMMGIR